MDKKIIIFSALALVGGFALGYLCGKKKGEKTSSAMGDGDFKKGAYEKAWDN